MRHAMILALALATVSSAAPAQERIFSGPQVGEKLSPFVAEYVFDDKTGEEVDFVKDADGGPLVLAFVHEITRPSIALNRLVLEYAHGRATDGLSTGVVFLTEDPTDMRARLNRARHALPKGVPITISREGIDGPGAYGLNRKVSVTLLIANQNKITANFALVQPGVAVDAPKIGAAIAAVLGDTKKPTLADMGGVPNRYRAAERMADVPEFRSMMAPVIRKGRTEEQVKKAAKAVEELAKKNEAFRTRLGEVAQRIIDAGKLDNYGTPPAREYLKKWAKEYGPAKKERSKSSQAESQP